MDLPLISLGRLPRKLEVEHEWRASCSEVTHVETLRAPNPHPRTQRLMHVAEKCEPRLRPLDQFKKRVTADFESPGNDVERQLRDRRWNVGTQHVDVAQAPNSLVKLRDRNLIGSPIRRWQTIANKSEAQAVNLDHLAIKDS